MSRSIALPVVLFLLLSCCAYASAATDAPRIGIATMEPGEIFFERFGHNAIIVDDPARAEPLSYNFGFFDLDEEGFLGRFVRGDMLYRLAELPWREDLSYYRSSGRGVIVQWLDLDPAAAQALAAALADNARPENSRYRYDYFVDNCATRVRDAIDRATGGALKGTLTARTHHNSYRSEAVRLASPASWMWLGFDLGLGPASDRPLSQWEDAYVPMRLADSLRGVRLDNGRPLVRQEERVAEHRIAPEPAEFRFVWWRWLIGGIALAALWTFARARAPRTAAAFALLFWSMAALLGVTMLLIWLGTLHRFGWANHNLLLLSPLSLLLWPGAWGASRGRAPGRMFRLALITITALAALAPALHWAMPDAQANAHWIALLLPVHTAFALAWLRRPATGAPSAGRRASTTLS